MPLFRRPKPRSGQRADRLVDVAPPVASVAPLADEAFQSLLHPLPQEIAGALWQRRRPAARFAARRLRPGERAAPGVSRLGGEPDLPPGFAWPSWRGPDAKGEARFLKFYAQVDLEPVASHLDLPLPPSGHLLFFADFDVGDGIMGLYSDELLGARVLYVPADHPLARASTPAALPALPEAVIVPLLSVTFPEPDFGVVGDDAYDAFDNLQVGVEALLRHNAPEGFACTGRHQLGGHGAYIQHPVEEEVVQAANDVYRRNGGFDAARWDQIKRDVARWRVLFQFDSDESLDLMWGDVGTLWWAAPLDNIEAADFPDARFNFQCS